MSEENKEEKKVPLTEVAMLNGGNVKIVMSLALTPQGTQAPVFMLVLPSRPELEPNTITLSELAVLHQLVETALRESISLLSTVAGE
jgi:hypothetical protein